MSDDRRRLAHTRTVIRVGGKAVKGSGKVLGAVSGYTRSTAAWTMGRVLGPHAYRRQVDDLVGRLSDALDAMEAVITAQEVEIDRLRAENAALRSARS